MKKYFEPILLIIIYTLFLFIKNVPIIVSDIFGILIFILSLFIFIKGIYVLVKKKDIYRGVLFILCFVIMIIVWIGELNELYWE